VDLRSCRAGGWGLGWIAGLTVIPDRDFAVVALVNAATQYRARCELAAIAEVLDLPSLEPAASADDHDPNVYVGRYQLDSGFGTTRITLEETGNLVGRSRGIARAETLARGRRPRQIGAERHRFRPVILPG
jgi:hypothetical protein